MKIAVYGQYYKENTGEIIKKMFGVFEKFNPEIVFESHFYEQAKKNNALHKNYNIFESYKEINDSFNFFIGIGGDGTILRAATYVRDTGVPIIGINAGRLGFLANVQQEKIDELLPLLFENKFKISPRTLLSLDYGQKHSELGDLDFALNEITVSRKDTTSMITVKVKLDGEHLNSYWADGLIISTPTGSTGYSLSCGGPLLSPEVNSVVITPIAPHNLTVRPLVIPDDTVIELTVSSREEQHLISLDSRRISVDVETTITIKKTSFKINMVEFHDEKFLKTVRKKLLWGEDTRN